MVCGGAIERRGIGMDGQVLEEIESDRACSMAGSVVDFCV